MTKNNNEDYGTDITELPTGEYPALRPAGVDDAVEHGGEPTAVDRTSHAAQADGASQAVPAEKDDAVKAAFWLSHLESEVTRLHAKWQTIDAEFKTREARIAHLNQLIAAREATIAALRSDLDRDAESLQQAAERISAKDSEIAALTRDRRMRDERIAALSTELADAAVAHTATRAELERAQGEVARLNDVIKQEQAAAAASAARNEQLVAEQGQLQHKLQDLEIYINGRHDSWTDQNAKIAGYKDALLGMEKTVKARDTALERQEDERRQLTARIGELERQCAELAGRRKEREEAYDDLQRRLAAHIEQTEQLKSEHAGRAKELEQAAKQAGERQGRIESLERDLERRDATIEKLTNEAEQTRSALDELTTANGELAGRVDELEKGADDRSQQLQTLRLDLRMAHDQLRAAQQQLSDRTTQLAASQEAVDQKTRHIERLVADLNAAQQQATEAREELGKLEDHADELGRLRGEAVAEAATLRIELGAQRELVAHLETELKSKQAAADLLERNVDRITGLGASLAALDREMNPGASDDDEVPPADKSSMHLADFVATLAAGDKADAADQAAEELLPMDLLLDDSPNEVVDVGEATEAGGGRKLVITIGGEAFTYPIVKSSMTIGRGHGADIRIASHFVSRVHAKISTKGIATIIEDAGSKNGILVNSERVQRRVLHHGDVVSLGGEFNLRFVDAVH